MDISKRRYNVIVLILGLFVGLFAGFIIGADYTINKAIDIAQRFDLNITFDREMVYQAIYQYDNRIGACIEINDLTWENKSEAID